VNFLGSMGVGSYSTTVLFVLSGLYDVMNPRNQQYQIPDTIKTTVESTIIGDESKVAIPISNGDIKEGDTVLVVPTKPDEPTDETMDETKEA
jgi:hypothetical protein